MGKVKPEKSYGYILNRHLFGDWHLSHLMDTNAFLIFLQSKNRLCALLLARWDTAILDHETYADLRN